MKILSTVFSPGIRLVALGAIAIGMLLLLRFQLSLYWFSMTKTMAGGLEYVSSVSWVIVKYGVLMYVGIALFGVFVSYFSRREKSLDFLEHRIFHAAILFSLSWVSIVVRTSMFGFVPFDAPVVLGALITSLLVSLTVKFKK
jgi:hypothetical protein